jgi:hypothetical protein
MGSVAACKAATEPTLSVISIVATNSNYSAKAYNATETTLVRGKNLSYYLRLIFLLRNPG